MVVPPRRAGPVHDARIILGPGTLNRCLLALARALAPAPPAPSPFGLLVESLASSFRALLATGTKIFFSTGTESLLQTFPSPLSFSLIARTLAALLAAHPAAPSLSLARTPFKNEPVHPREAKEIYIL